MRPVGGPLATPGKRRLAELPQFWRRPPQSPLSTQQMQAVVKCMTNTVAGHGTIVQEYWGMVILGKKMGRQRNQAGICVCGGLGEMLASSCG